jgi:hypothetical protein
MNDILTEIFSPIVKFESVNRIEKFCSTLAILYRINLFKEGLDLILTKTQEKDLSFEVKIIKGWDTNLGCYLTEQSKIFNSIFSTFSNKIQKKIILRQLTPNLMAHEMAHAIEFESGINLQNEFRDSIIFDMKGRMPEKITLKAEIQRLMIDALKTYPKHQHISELFARYFELLTMSREINQNGDFTADEVYQYFINTTKFIKEIFNKKIALKIDKKIATSTFSIIKSQQEKKSTKNFSEKIESRKEKSGSNWSKSVRSNASYHKSYLASNQIEDKK